MEDQKSEKLQLLKAKVPKKNLEIFLRPYFSMLVSKTTNTHRLVMALFEEGVLSSSEMDVCLSEPVGFYRNLELYNILMKKNVGVSLIDALYYSDNDHILQILESDLDQSTVNSSSSRPEENLTSKLSCVNITEQVKNTLFLGSTLTAIKALGSELQTTTTPTMESTSKPASYLTERIADQTGQEKLLSSGSSNLTTGLQTNLPVKSGKIGHERTHGEQDHPKSKPSSSTSSSSFGDLPTINLLLLGQTGVGKTTFLNSFHTYLSYESLEDAVADSHFNTLTPMKFESVDLWSRSYERVADGHTKHSEQLLSSYPEMNKNYDKVGEAVDQHPVSHTFIMDDLKIRMIDIPVMGDHGGIAKDNVKSYEISQFLKTVQEIHGILILLNPDEPQMDQTLDHCLQQLVLNLPREAVNNFIFAFTTDSPRRRAMETYDAKKLLLLLQDVIQNIQDSRGVVIPMKKENVFYFDNSVIPYILMHRKDPPDDHRMRVSNIDWNKGAKEIKRLLKYVKSRRPLTPPYLQNAIVVCGNTGAGKSYLCNRIFELYNVETRFKSSLGVESQTSAIQHAQFTRPDGKTFTLIDTPGFFDNHDPKKTAEVDGKNMCKLVAALEACSDIYAIVFIFSDRFSTPHKLWFDRIRSVLTPGQAGHILLLHNKVTLTLDQQIDRIRTILTPGRAGHILLLHNKVTLTLREQTVNEVKIKGMVGGQESIEYHWLSYNATDGDVQKFVDSIAKLVPFKLSNLVVPEMCYEREEIGPEYTEVIAGPFTKDEGHFEVQTKEVGHYEVQDKDTGHWKTVIWDKGHMVTKTQKGGRRFVVAGPKSKTMTKKWVPNLVAEDVWVKSSFREQVWVPETTKEKVWVQRNVTPRALGIYQNVYKVRFDGTRDLWEKKFIRRVKEVY